MSHSQSNYNDEQYDGSGTSGWDDENGCYYDDYYDDTHGYYGQDSYYTDLCEHNQYYFDCTLCSRYHTDETRGGTGTTPPPDNVDGLGRRPYSGDKKDYTEDKESSSVSKENQSDPGPRTGENQSESGSQTGKSQDSSEQTLGVDPDIIIKKKKDEKKPWHDYVEPTSSPSPCSHCNRFGHSVDTCYQLSVCSECGLKGHPAKFCRNRSKAKKQKGKGDRGTKKNDLVNKSLSQEDDKNKAREDALKEEIGYLKDLVSDEKENVKDLKEIVEEKNEEVDLKARREGRFGKKKRSVNEFVRSIYTDDELGLGGLPKDAPIIGVDNELTVVEVNEDDWVDRGVMPMPSPVDVVDDYDEDPRSYTFTSNVEFPSGKMLFDFCRESLSWELLGFLISQFVSFSICCLIFLPPLFFAVVGFLTAIIAPFAPQVASVSLVLYFLLVFSLNASFLTFLVGVIKLFLRVLDCVRHMVRWKNTYTFLNYLDADEADLRTDNQQRSDPKHKDAVYARYRYKRRLLISYSENYKDVGPFTFVLSRLIAWGITCLGKYVPGWLVEMDKEIVVSLEAFDQVKDFTNMDFESSDQIASDKIRTALKRIGTVLINRHLKTDPVYTTVFLAWAYFKHQQQKNRALPFYRAPLNLT